MCVLLDHFSFHLFHIPLILYRCGNSHVLVLRVYAAKADGFDTASLVVLLMCLVRQIIVFKHTV